MWPKYRSTLDSSWFSFFLSFPPIQPTFCYTPLLLKIFSNGSLAISFSFWPQIPLPFYCRLCRLQSCKHVQLPGYNNVHISLNSLMWLADAIHKVQHERARMGKWILRQLGMKIWLLRRWKVRSRYISVTPLEPWCLLKDVTWNLRIIGSLKKPSFPILGSFLISICHILL